MYDLILGLDRSKYEPIVVYRNDNFLAAKLREAGVEVHIFPPRTALTFRQPWLRILLAPIKKATNLVLGFIVPVIRFARFMRRMKFDLVNLNNSITRYHPWMVAARLAGTPCITHEMGINEEYPFLARVLGSRLDAVICLSYAIRDAMSEQGVDLSNVVVIHCGIDARRYRLLESPADLRRKHGIPDGAPVIGVVGNIRGWKGQETIVRATALLKRRFPEIRCVLVGVQTVHDMPYLDLLKSICSESGIENNVVFAGFQQNAIDYMRLMDVVAHTSVLPEPFGIVTLEAMLLSKPLVSTTIGGPAEVVVNGVTGFLVQPGKPDLLAAAIEQLLLDPALAAEMGRKGYVRLQSDFSLEKNVSQTMAIYERILQGEGSSKGPTQNEAIHP